MKVLIVTSMYPRPDKNYYARFIHQQAIELSKLGAHVRVICPIAVFRKPTDVLTEITSLLRPATSITIDNIPVAYVRYMNIPHSLSVRLEIASHYHSLYKYIKSIRSTFKFDIIHAHRLFPTGYVAMLIARKFGVPFVASARGSDIHTNPVRNNGIARYTKATIMMSDQVLSVSKTLAREITSLAKPAAPVRVIYNGVDQDQFKPFPEQRSSRKRFDLPEEGIGLCTISRLVKEKGLVELLKAFEEITFQHKNVWLAIVGSGPLQSRLKRWVQERCLQNNVYFAGSRHHNEIPYWLIASDIFVLASYNEGLPNVILEAMACARPVIATDVGGIPEAVEDKVSALLIPPGRVPPLVDALSELIKNPELRKRIGKAGYDYVRNKFSWPQNTRFLLDILLGLKHNKSHGI